MHNFTVASINCNCMFQLHKVANIRVYISEVQKGNYIPVFYVPLRVVSGQVLGLTGKGIYDCYDYYTCMCRSHVYLYM